VVAALSSSPELRLNLLPVAFPGTEPDVIYALPRDEQDSLRTKSDEGKAFHVYSHSDKVFFWTRSGQQLPGDLDVARASTFLPSALPSAVTCFAVRNAVVDRLVDHSGFELIGRGSVQAPTRLFRRQRNLAADALSQAAQAAGETIGPETGVFPYLAVQCIPFGDSRIPGQIALVLDAGLVNRLDVALADLASAGIDLNGVRVVWNHGEHCTCGFDQLQGEAGRISGGDTRAAVDVLMQGEKRTVSAECLRLLASREEIDRYFTSLLSQNKNVEQMIRQRILAFHDSNTQWKLLDQTRKALDPLTVFSATVVSLGEPVTADSTGASGVTLLTPLPSEPALNFQYGAPIIYQGAAVGLNRHGPYDRDVTARVDKVKAVIVFPGQFSGDAQRLRKALVSGVDNFPGLKDRYALTSLDVDLHSFSGGSASDYKTAANAATAPTSTGAPPDVVFLITQRSDRNSPRGQNPYFAAKAVLANAGVPSQAVTIDVLRQADSYFKWSIQSIALQVYAKLGNIPWVLRDEEGANELVVGVGRHDIYLAGEGYQKQMFGAAAAFRQDGDFLFAGSTVPVVERDSYEETLADLLTEFINRYEHEQAKSLDRLTVHLFKRTGPKELRAIERAINGRNIEFALVHVNRDTPLWLVEETGGGIEAAPVGTVVALDEGDRLLMTGEHGTGKKRNPHPLRLTLDRNSTFRDMDRITAQVYGFTATSWRGFRTTYEPSSILYGRLLAEKVSDLIPYGFDAARAAAIGGKPWFL
jgi:hypothetical protein